MRHKDCQNPLRIYSHIAPYMGGPEKIMNTNGAGDGALAALLHDITANAYHRQNQRAEFQQAQVQQLADLFVAGAGVQIRQPRELSGAEPALTAPNAWPAGAGRQPRRGVLGQVITAG